MWESGGASRSAYLMSKKKKKKGVEGKEKKRGRKQGLGKQAQKSLQGMGGTSAQMLGWDGECVCVCGDPELQYLYLVNEHQLL